MNIIKIKIPNYNSKVEIIIQNNFEREFKPNSIKTKSSPNKANSSWWDDSPSTCGMYVSDLY